MSIPYKRAEEEIRSLFMMVIRDHDAGAFLSGVLNDGTLRLEIINCPEKKHAAILQDFMNMAESFNNPHLVIEIEMPKKNIILNVKSINHVIERKAAELLLEHSKTKEEKGEEDKKETLADRIVNEQFKELERYNKDFHAVNMMPHFMIGLAKNIGLSEPLISRMKQAVTKLDKPSANVQKQMHGIFKLLLKSRLLDSKFTTRTKGNIFTLSNSPISEVQNVINDIDAQIAGFKSGVKREISEGATTEIKIIIDTMDPYVIQRAPALLERAEKGLADFIGECKTKKIVDRNVADFPAVNISARLMLKIAKDLNMPQALQKDLQAEVSAQINR